MLKNGHCMQYLRTLVRVSALILTGTVLVACKPRPVPVSEQPVVSPASGMIAATAGGAAIAPKADEMVENSDGLVVDEHEHLGRDINEVADQLDIKVKQDLQQRIEMRRQAGQQVQASANGRALKLNGARDSVSVVVKKPDGKVLVYHHAEALHQPVPDSADPASESVAAP